MKKLIICEKPSLAKNVSNAIKMIGEAVRYNDGCSGSQSNVT